jgi:hypothetical protein
MVAVDGSKFRAVSSAKSVRERDAMKRYLEQLDAADEQDEVVIDPSAVRAALEKLKRHPEPEAHLMRTANGFAPAYNVQTAVDAEHALIVAQKVTEEATDNRSLLPMAVAAKAAVGDPPTLNVVADAGYSNGEQAEACEAQGIRRNSPLADRTGQLQACEKFLGTTNAVLCYRQTFRSLFCYRKHCLVNMFVTEEAFFVFRFANNEG